MRFTPTSDHVSTASRAHWCPTARWGPGEGATKAVTSGHQGLPEGGGGGCWEELEKTRGERRWAGTWGMLGSAVVRPFQTLVLGTSDTASSKSQQEVQGQ